MFSLVFLTSTLVYLFVHYANAVSFGQQSKINFGALSQAQKLWDDPKILGNSTVFKHPVSLGTCKLIIFIFTFDI